MKATTHIALLRGINVGGNKKVPMADLREVALGLGWGRPATYIQSGNLWFDAPLTAAAAQETLEGAIERRFGFRVEVIVRSVPQWRRYAQGSPFPDAEADRPHLLHLGLSKRPPNADAADRQREYARAGERLAAVGDALWVDFGAAVASSKLTPAVLDRVVGSPVTMRNWKTVCKLAELVAAVGAGAD
jgi:uncharacterized protein (DUF1697 family)